MLSQLNGARQTNKAGAPHFRGSAGPEIQSLKEKVA
jgi:hypothetical protein